ncbi:TraB/GumN family protein [Herbaspirillum camelliae]|uniref:TraB/GumN family protein n=1 Tax=Herbaspirillum camelliae TaxID=1892903 RepID=UPI000949F7D7|nr:TraB/GumN family protein [Herbaspirillum camelliae]
MYFQIDNTNVRVLGSIHFFPENVPGVPRWALEAYDWAEEIALEVDWSNVGDLFSLPEGESFANQVPADVWTWLEAHWPPAYGELGRKPAWFVITQVAQIGVKLQPGLDLHIRAFAERDGKPLHFLETAPQFDSMMKAIPPVDIERALREAIANFPENDKSFKGLYADWVKRDLATMFRRIQKKAIVTIPSLRHAVLTGRNASWASGVNELCKSPQKTLVVVGGLHLYEEGNLLQQIGRPTSPIEQKGRT